MVQMLNVGKSLTWIITSVVGVVAGIGALVFNNSASADGVMDNLPLLHHLHHHHHDPPPVVPEVNTGLVLLPIVLAILIFTSRHLLRRRGYGNR
jgi:hypothetical protein